jgi:hypothetical protein
MELNPPAMDEPQEIKQSRSIRIGPDQVTITDQEVVIEAKHELPDWQVREFKAIPIYFEDKKYFLVEKRKVQLRYAFRYVLRPWPESHMESAAFFLMDSLLLLAFLADVPVRYAHYLKEEEWAGGFLEWMVPRSLRKK